MVLIKKTLILIFICAPLFFIFFSLLRVEAGAASASAPGPSPTPTPTPVPTSSPSPGSGPSPNFSPTPTPSPSYSYSPSPSPGPAPDSSISRKLALKASQIEGSKVARKQLQKIEQRIDEFKAILTKRLADPKTSGKTQQCLAQCEDNFEDAIDSVKMSIESINKQDLPKANVDVSAISTDVDTCNDCFKEMIGEDKQIKGFDNWIRGVTGDCLENLQKT